MAGIDSRVDSMFLARGSLARPFAGRLLSSFADTKRKRTIPSIALPGKPSVLRGMVSRVLFRSSGYSIAVLKIDDPAVEPTDFTTVPKTVTIQSTNGALSAQDVGDHVEVQGECVRSFKKGREHVAFRFV